MTYNRKRDWSEVRSVVVGPARSFSSDWSAACKMISLVLSEMLRVGRVADNRLSYSIDCRQSLVIENSHLENSRHFFLAFIVKTIDELL